MSLQEYLELNVKIIEEDLKDKENEDIKEFLQTKLKTIKSIQEDIGIIIDL